MSFYNKTNFPILLLFFFLLLPTFAMSITVDTEIKEANVLIERLKKVTYGTKTADKLAMEIMHNYQCKLLLKSDKKLGSIFHNLMYGHDGKHGLAKKILDKAKIKLSNKYPSLSKRMESIRNQSSIDAKKPPMDLDFGILAKDDNDLKNILKKIKASGGNIENFHHEIKEALHNSFKEIGGELGLPLSSPEKAFISGTTGFHPEAYKDIGAIKGNTPLKKWAFQSADVSRFKINELQKLAAKGSISVESAAQEAARGTLKDLDKVDKTFAGIAERTGKTPKLSDSNKELRELLQELEDAKDPRAIRKAINKIQSLKGRRNVFDVCNNLIDNMEAAWKLAPMGDPELLLKKLFKDILPKKDINKAIRALESGKLDDFPASAITLQKKIFYLTASKHTKLSNLSVEKLLVKLQKPYGLGSLSGDSKQILIELLEAVEKTNDQKVLKMVIGEFHTDALVKIKKLMPKKLKVSLIKRLASRIPLKDLDGAWTSLKLGDGSGALGVDGLIGVAMMYNDIGNIMDKKNLSPAQESRELQKAIVINLPIIGDLMMSIDSGIEAGFEGSYSKGAQSAGYLVIGIAGFVPGAQIPALIAGLAMASGQIGGMAWDAYWDRKLIEAWIKSGVWSKDGNGKLEGLKDKNNNEFEINFDSLVNNENGKYTLDYYDMTIRESILDYTRTRLLSGNKMIKSFKSAILQIYPNANIAEAIKQPRKQGEDLIRMVIKNAGDGATITPRGKERNAAIAIYRKYKEAVDAQSVNAINYLKSQAEKEYQARHHVGEALKIFRKLDALGKRIGLPLVDRVHSIFNSYTGMVKAIVSTPFIIESLPLRQVEMVERYYKGYSIIEKQLRKIDEMFKMVDIKMPSHKMSGYLEIDTLRMADLQSTYMSNAIIPARKEVERAYREETGDKSYHFNPKDTDYCQLKLFKKLGGILVKKVDNEDRRLLLEQWSGKKSAAEASRDQAKQKLQAIQKNENVNINVNPLSLGFSKNGLGKEINIAVPTLKALRHLTEAQESAYAWANVRWEGSQVYEDALEIHKERAKKLEIEYRKAKNTATLDLKFCLEKLPKIILTFSEQKFMQGDTVLAEAKVSSGEVPKDSEWKWFAKGNITLKGSYLSTATYISDGNGTVTVHLVHEKQILAQASKDLIISLKENEIPKDENSDVMSSAEEKKTTKTEEYWIAKIENAHTKKDWKKLLEIQVELMEANRKKYHSSAITREPYLKPLKLLNKYLKEFGQKKWDWFKKDVSRYLNELFNKSEDEYRTLEDRVNRSIFEKKGTQEEADKCLKGAKKRAKAVRKTIQKAKKEHSITLKKLFDNQGNSTKILVYIKDFLIKYNIPQDLKVSISYSAPCLDGSDENATKKLTVKISGSKKYYIKPTETIRLIAIVSGGKSPVDIRWEGGNISPSGTTAIFAATTPGSYSVQITVKDANGESISDAVSIVVEKIDLPTLSGLPNEVYYGTTKIISVEGLEESTVPKKEESSSSGNMIDCKTHPDNPFCVDTSTGQMHRNITQYGDDSAPGVIMAPADDTEDFGVPEIKKEENGEYKYIWQPTGEGLEFNPPEGNQPQVKVTFGNIGDVEIWAEVHKDGKLLGETEPIKTKVVPPKFSLKVSPLAPYIGSESKVLIEVNPNIDNKYLNFRWLPMGEKVQEVGELNNGRAYIFKTKSIKPSMIEVLVWAVPYAEEQIADLKKNVSGKPYKVDVIVLGPLGPKPMIWKEGKGLVEVDKETAIYQNVRLKVTISPKPKKNIRYEWKLNEDSHFAGGSSGSEVMLNRSQTGTCVATVIIKNDDGIVLGKGSGSFSVTISQQQMDTGKQKAKDKKKSKELLHEARKLWKEGKLQQAIVKVAQAQKLVVKDKEITKTLKTMQMQKKQLDDKLIVTSKLIKQDKLYTAKNLLDSAAMISAKYEKYKKVLKQLAYAKKKVEEKKKQIAKLLKNAKILKDDGKFDKAILILKEGSKQFPGNEEIDKLFKEIQKQQSDARKKMAEGQKQWKEGMLDKAVDALKKADKIDPSNKQIIKVLMGMQSQKKIMDDSLQKIDLLISQKKFKQAESRLKKVGYISIKYLYYKKMVKKLESEKKKNKEYANALIKNAKDLWNAGKLGDAIATLIKGSGEFISNEKIKQSLKKRKQEKKNLDSMIHRAEQLIGQKKFTNAKDLLHKAGLISQKYLPYIKAIKRLNIEKEKAYKLKRRQADALNKMSEGWRLWKNGILDKAISTLSEATKIDPLNKKITKVLKDIRTQKKIIDDTLIEVKGLLVHKKFSDATKVLQKVESINNKYLPYLQMVKELNSAKLKAEELKNELKKILKNALRLKNSGKLSKAIKVLKKGYKKFPHNEQIDKLLKDIQKQQAEEKPRTEKIDNIGGVVNGPKKPTTFKFNTKVKLLFIQTYHWNNGRGTTSPGQIGLRHSDGTMYGPWQTEGKAGQGGVPNANWAVNPNIILKSGTYKVIDSDPKTWATNAQEGWKGFVIIRTGPVNYLDERSVRTSKVNSNNSSKDNLKIEAKYLGCYRDKGVVESAKDRDIDGYYNRSSHMTIKTCAVLCSKKGFKYAGVQYAYGCFCGNSFGRYGIASNCNMPCTGNKNEICGGSWANSVYALTRIDLSHSGNKKVQIMNWNGKYKTRLKDGTEIIIIFKQIGNSLRGKALIDSETLVLITGKVNGRNASISYMDEDGKSVVIKAYLTDNGSRMIIKDPDITIYFHRI